MSEWRTVSQWAEWSEKYDHDYDPRYSELADVLHDAYEQAANGKGRDRHDWGEDFTSQWICDGLYYHGVGAALFQAEKKIREVHKLGDNPAKVHELLGAIVYLAAAVLHLRQKEEDLEAMTTRRSQVISYGEDDREAYLDGLAASEEPNA